MARMPVNPKALFIVNAERSLFFLGCFERVDCKAEQSIMVFTKRTFS